MSDIMKFILNTDAATQDPYGHMLALNDWSEAIASQLAAEQGIVLTAEHFEVLHFMRDYFNEHGAAHSAREMTAALEHRFSVKGGGRYLFLLFPDGPVRNGCHLAGLPVPSHSEDPAFGSIQ